jgi:hypothetical protein
MVTVATEPTMPTESGKPLIVISYAHADEPEHPAEGEVKWLSFVTGYLRPAIKHGAVELWLDRLMPGGEWEPVAEQKLLACDIFILLVSQNSLSSYVVDGRIRIIRERQARGETVHFYPLVLTPTHKHWLDLVRDQNLRPRDGKPFSDHSINDRSRHMNEVANEIANLAEEIKARMRSPSVASPQRTTQEDTDSAVTNIKDRASLEAWLRKQPREIAATIAARAALRVAPLIGGAPLELGELIGSTFRGAAMARVAGKYPGGNYERDASAAARTARAAAITARVAHADGAANAAQAASYAASTLYGTGAARAAARAAIAARTAGPATSIWLEVITDTIELSGNGVVVLADRPLWSVDQPDWVADSWAKLRANLPEGEDWQIWIDWYEERLRGGSRGEAYEFVFASVPQEEWEKGPAVANAWIKRHLPAEELQAISGAFSLEAWLITQTRETATAIAVRAAARVAPLGARPDSVWTW